MHRYIARSVALAALAFSSVALSHHSAAPFDFTKSVVLEGVVKMFRVGNPHAGAILLVTDRRGTREVKFEGHSASIFYRSGWRPGMVKAGDRIKVTIAPRRDGMDGGFIVSFVTTKGVTLGFGGTSPTS